MKYLEYIVHATNIGVVLHFLSFSSAAQLYIGNLTAYSNLSSLRVDAHHSLMVDAKLAMFDTLPRKD